MKYNLINLQIHRLTQENKTLQNTKAETLNYIDSQRNMMHKLYLKKKERLENTFQNIRQRDIEEKSKIPEDYENVITLLKKVSGNFNKLKLSKFSSNMKGSLLQFPQEDLANKHNTFLKQTLTADPEIKLEESTEKINHQREEPDTSRINKVNTNKDNTFINDFQVKKSITNLVFNTKNYLGKNLFTETCNNNKVEIFKLPRSELKLVERTFGKGEQEGTEQLKQVIAQDLLKNKNFKIKIKFEYCGCPNETFQKLEKVYII